MTQPLLEVWVPGKPKTKGSLDVVNARRGRAVVRENVVGSKRWRELVAYKVAFAQGEAMADGMTWPIEGAVAVDLYFTLPTKDVTQARVGDIDKLARNILDALQDAGVYRDDVQVVRLTAAKHPDPLQRPGVTIKVWRC